MGNRCYTKREDEPFHGVREKRVAGVTGGKGKHRVRGQTKVEHASFARIGSIIVPPPNTRNEASHVCIRDVLSSTD